MKTLLELLDAWEDCALGAEDVEELKRLLANPEARAELVGDWLLHGALYERLREEKAAKEAAALLAANAPAPSRESAGVTPRLAAAFPAPGRNRAGCRLAQSRAGGRRCAGCSHGMATAQDSKT